MQTKILKANYGLAADAKNEAAIQKIFDVKGRPRNHLLILHIVLNKNNNVSDIITGGLNTVAIRVPKHLAILDVINKLGNGIVAPYANAYQKTSPKKSIHVLKTLDGKIPAVLDGGISSIGIESTIIEMTKDVPTILRYGAVTKEMIEEIPQLEIKCPINHNQKISGNMKNHYQPKRPLFLLSTNQIESLLSEEGGSAIMYYSNISKKIGSFTIKCHKIKNNTLSIYTVLRMRLIAWE